MRGPERAVQESNDNAAAAKVPRKRRPRTSRDQLVVLNEAYILEPMPCAAYREALGKQVK